MLNPAVGDELTSTPCRTPHSEIEFGVTGLETTIPLSAQTGDFLERLLEQT